MRETVVAGWRLQVSPGALLRAALVVLGIGLVMGSSAARAQEDDEEGKSFEDKLIDGIMTGIGGTNMDNRGIEYRERSPLVVPPRIDLPPPTTATANVNAPNWPKDPDVARRKAAIAARKKSKPDPTESARPLKPDELNVGRTAAPVRANNDPIEPGVSNSPMLSPSQLGFDGRFSSLFGGNKNEEVPFKGEPDRDSLTMPPTGYQTPSPNFPYGTGPKVMAPKQYDSASGLPKE